MKVSFPYMGCVTGYEKLFEWLGHEVIAPTKPTQRTIDLGVLYSPEFICFPFKVMMGTYVEVCERGAEMIVSSGGSGPCRAGLYGEVHRRVLRQLGYQTEIVIFDSMFRDFKTFARQILALKGSTRVGQALRHIYLAYRMICQMDELEKELKVRRAYELRPGSFDRAWEQIVQKHKACDTIKQLKAAGEESRKILDAVPVKPAGEADRVRIGIVGEIYVIMESASNLEVERRLNNLGAEVTNVQYISDWLRHNLLPRAINRSESWKMWEKAEAFKSCNCGGHDMENTGWIAEFAERGYDGVVHLLPFGCLPELVTRSMIPQMSEQLDLPILSISLDEQLGEANLQTRLEAFVDLCRSRRRERAANLCVKPAPVPGGQYAAAEI